MDELMKDLLRDLAAKWQQVSQYDDMQALSWVPGEPIASTCPQGCTVVDTGWRSMLHEDQGVDAFRRTVFCRDHGFARIYVISGPAAIRHGWEPAGD
jgi:hypothetical protein